MKKKIIVTIDGPAGAGKSTMAKLVAKKLDYLYVDTGAMYRTITWKVLENRISLKDKKNIVKLAENTDIKLIQKKDKLKVLAGGRDVSGKIRTEEVGKSINIVSAIPGVRNILRKKQREMGRSGGIVMEGRDIGTAVFPEAEKKFYLDADPHERALRRWKELKSKGETVSLKRIESAIIKRDYLDKHRAVSPLKKAKDAVVINSTGLRIPQVVDIMVKEIGMTARRAQEL